MSCEHKWTEDKYTPADDKTCVRCCESKREADLRARIAELERERAEKAEAEAAALREALENCVEDMDSADYFRSLAIRNAAIDRARKALKGGGR